MTSEDCTTTAVLWITVMQPALGYVVPVLYLLYVECFFWGRWYEWFRSAAVKYWSGINRGHTNIFSQIILRD